MLFVLVYHNGSQLKIRYHQLNFNNKNKFSKLTYYAYYKKISHKDNKQKIMYQFQDYFFPRICYTIRVTILKLNLSCSTNFYLKKIKTHDFLHKFIQAVKPTILNRHQPPARKERSSCSRKANHSSKRAQQLYSQGKSSKVSPWLTAAQLNTFCRFAVMYQAT